jgi:hypothetical protein
VVDFGQQHGCMLPLGATFAPTLLPSD